MLTYLTEPVLSTIPFWERVSEHTSDKKIAYISCHNAQSALLALDQPHEADAYLIDTSAEIWSDVSIQDFSSFTHDKIKDKPVLFLTADPLWFFKKSDRYAFLPIWYYDVYYSNLNYRKSYFNPEKRYLVSCLNRAPKEHRAYNLIRMYKEGLLDHSRLLLTYKQYDPYHLDSSLQPNAEERIIYPQSMSWSSLTSDLLSSRKTNVESIISDIKQTYLMLFNTMPINPLNEDLTTVLDDHTVQHDAYQKSMVNLITESDINYIFFTEKTFKALSVGMPFWLQGKTNSILYLDLLGFDTYKDIDIFDYSTYDPCMSFIDRTDKIAAYARTVLKSNIYLDLDISQRQLKNQEQFYSDKTYNMFLHHLLDKIDKILCC